MCYYFFEIIYIPESILSKKKHLCYYPGRIGDAPVMLAKPQTFMNASGESVSITIRKKL
jgi:peptidyl-tRNA hydrolase